MPDGDALTILDASACKLKNNELIVVSGSGQLADFKEI
jgi:hypothetical protein